MNLTKKYLKTVREEFDGLIAQALIDHPELTQAEIGAQFQVSRYWVIDVGKKFGIVRPVGRKASKKAVAQ
jgi:hypothetical protein